MKSPRFWIVSGTALLICGVVFILGWWLAPMYSFNRWDNFEFFTPIIHYSQSVLLSGYFPHWNIHNNLGEPLHANGQAGVLYPLYTLAEGLIELFHWQPDRIPLIVALIHLTVLMTGCWVFLLLNGVNWLLSLGCALAGMTCGYVLCYSMIWIFMTGYVAWLPWLTLGLQRLSQNQKGGVSLLVVSLVASAALSHPQELFYTWVYAVVLALAFVVVYRPRHPVAGVGLVSGLAAVLMSAPMILPIAQITTYSARAHRVPWGDYSAYGLSWAGLWGLFSPLIEGDNGFGYSHGTVMLYVGSWFAPVLLLGLLFRQDRHRVFLALFTVALGFLLLAMGENGHLYELLYHVPIWSSMRWPFKLLPDALIPGTLAAGLGLQQWAQLRTSHAWPKMLWAIWVATPLGLILALVNMGPSELFHTRAGWLVCLAGLGSWLALLRIDQRWARATFTFACVLSAIAMMALIQGIPFHIYADDRDQSPLDAQVYSDDYRVMPISGPTFDASRVRPLALFHSATANGFLSATGMTSQLAPVWFRSKLDSNPWGFIPDGQLHELIRSRLIDTLAIRYLLAQDTNRASLSWLLSEAHYQVRRLADGVDVYENPSAEKPVFFAGHVDLRDQVAPKSVQVDDISEPRDFSVGEILALARKPDGSLDVDVKMADSGFLVLAQTYFPEWRAQIDGRDVKVYRVNHLIQGLVVPKDARHIAMRFQTPYWGLSWVLFGAGLVLFILLVLRERFAKG